MVFLGHGIDKGVVCTGGGGEEVVELDGVVAGSGEEAAAGREGELHAWVDGCCVGWFCGADGGVGF